MDPRTMAAAFSKPATVPQSKYLAQALESMGKSGQNIQGGGGELAARLLAQAITQRAHGKATEREAVAAQERAMTQAQALFPDDPRAQAMFAASPEAMIGALAKGYEPQVLSQGQTLMQPGGQNFTAPIMGVDGGYGYTQTPDTIQWGAQRGQSYSEAETARSNDMGANLRKIGLGIQQQNADTSLAAHRARLAAGGYGTPGVGAAMGGQGPSDDEILRTLGIGR